MNRKRDDYNRRAIRKLLKQAFDATQLDSLCFDYYDDVFQQFSSGMKIDAKITLLLSHCRKLPTGLDSLLICALFNVVSILFYGIKLQS